MNATTRYDSAAPLTSEQLAAYLTTKADKAPQIWTSTMLGGASGTGKTYTAMLLARGLSEGKGFGFIDTENRRGLYYSDRFPEMDHLDMARIVDQMSGGQHEPEIYADAIRAMADLYKVIVLDSFSHTHEGIGGILEIHERELTRVAGTDPARREKNSYSAWGPVKPRERALAATIANCQAHVILCVRAKPALVRDGKLVRPTNLRSGRIPYALAANKDLIYEMTMSGVFRPERENRGVIWPEKLSDDLAHAVYLDRPLTARTGELMLEWSRGEGEAKKRTAFYNLAREQARNGATHMNEWVRGLTKEEKATLNPIYHELKEIVHKSEAAQAERERGFTAAPEPEAPAEDPAAEHEQHISGDLEEFVSQAVSKEQARRAQPETAPADEEEGAKPPPADPVDRKAAAPAGLA